MTQRYPALRQLDDLHMFLRRLNLMSDDELNEAIKDIGNGIINPGFTGITPERYAALLLHEISNQCKAISGRLRNVDGVMVGLYASPEHDSDRNSTPYFLIKWSDDR